MPEFRVTRPELYTGNCPGHNDVRQRQGHYVRTPDAQNAVLSVALDFPHDTIFDVEVWDGCGTSRGEVKFFHRNGKELGTLAPFPPKTNVSVCAICGGDGVKYGVPCQNCDGQGKMSN